MVEGLQQQKEDEDLAYVMPITKFTSNNEYKNENFNRTEGTNTNTNVNTFGSRYDNYLHNTKSATLDGKFNSNANTLLSKKIIFNNIKRSEIWGFI